MVSGIPSITLQTAYQQSVPLADIENTWGICLECTKGTPFEPVVVDSPDKLKRLFKVTRLDGYFGVGGRELLVTRVTAGTPVAAVHYLKDRTTPTALNVLKLTAKTVGSYPIYVSAGINIDGVSTLTIEESGMATEYYLGVPTIAKLIARINATSEIVTAEAVMSDDATPVKQYGTNTLATLTRTKLGSGGGDNVAGSNGTGNATTGELTSETAPVAHKTGLAMFADYPINGVFSISGYDTVQDEYVAHAIEMNAEDAHKFRFAIIGANGGDDKATMLTRTNEINSENVMYVGQGLVDLDGNHYGPNLATMAVAGKRSMLPYQVPIWGGQSNKRFGTVTPDGYMNFFVETLPIVDSNTITTKSDLIEYNEKGVITFTEDLDGVRIREAVMTTQPYNEDDELEEDEILVTQETEEAIMSIIQRVKLRIWQAVFAMQGRTITSDYKTTLEESIKSKLEYMKNTEKSLIELSSEGLPAYTVSATVVPRSNQKKGYVAIEASITPVHAARQISATIYVR